MRNVIIFLFLFLSSISAKRMNFEVEMNTLAEKVTRNISSGTGSLETLVIIPFNDSRAPGFADIIEQYLTMPLVEQGKVSVVDRTQLATQMAEAELQSMMAEPMAFGKMVAANYMLTGTVATGFDDNYRITLRIISMETSLVIGAASLEVPFKELNKRTSRK